MKKILLTGGVVIAAALTFVTMNAKKTQSPSDLVEQNANISIAEAVIPISPTTGNAVEDVAKAISNETEAENKIANEAEVSSADFTAEDTETNTINNFYDANKF